MIGLSYLLVGLIPGVDSRGELVRTLIATGVAVICTALAVSAVGMVEDVAAGRASVGMKRLRMVSGGALLVVAGLTVHASAGATLDLPPTPSKAPEQADFSVAPEESFLLVPESGVVPEVVTPDASSSSQHSPSTRVPAGADSAERRAPGNRTPGTTAPGTTAPVTTPEKPAGAVAITPVAAWENLAEEADEITRSEIVAMMRSWLLENNNGGLELAVVKPGKTRLTAAVNAKGESVEVADMIPLASVTKSYTTALLLRAADNGLLSLDQKVGPLSAAPWFTLVNDTTVGELLSHSSGLHNYTDTDVYREDWRKINGWESALQAVEAEGLLFAPGSKVEYSSTNFVVAGLLAAQIYGRPVEDLIRQELLSPLGLNRSVVGPPGPGAPGTGTGNMSAHITDVARWAKAMWRDKSVLNEYGNSLAAYTNPKHLLGYGSFAWCPCTTQRGKTIPAAMGHNGAELTMRYYAATDTILVLRVTGGVPANIEPLITSILSRVK
jgi:CubicO group peptidase (beta-lactamase class C family)